MKPTIKDTIVIDRNVGEALRMLEKRMAELHLSAGKDMLEVVKADYQLMLDCFERGIQDPNGDEVYMDLLRRTYNLYNNVRLDSILNRRVSFSQAKAIADSFSKDKDSIVSTLEGYVQDCAMASLLDETEQKEAIKKANAVHQQYVERLFNYIMVSGQWSDETTSFYLSLIQSPTIDQNDAQVIISAITISLLTVFDVNKWLVLAAIYENNNPMRLRYRALVGIMLSLPEGEHVLFPEVKSVLQRVFTNEEARRELVELQMNLYYCSHAEADSAEIERDIMPTFVKNNNLKITPISIEEKEESIDDILDYGATDRNLDEMEAKMKKMRDMQMSGSDIFFGGFSKTKQCSFFYQISNWFVPFYPDHPYVANLIDASLYDVVRSLSLYGTFCDSDVYSFVFSLSAISNQLPDNVKEMMANGPSGGMPCDVDRNSPAYIKLFYLQNLYRFFMLYQGHKDFTNPFADVDGVAGSGRFLFFGNELLHDVIVSDYVEIERFFFKNKKYEYVVKLANMSLGDETNVEEVSLLGHSYMKLGLYSDAYKTFMGLVDKGCNEASVLRGLADALFMLCKYDEAAEAYNRLILENGETKNLVVCQSIALVNSGKVKDGFSGLFKIDYEENGKNLVVKRAIAWGYLMDVKPLEAEKIYDQLVEGNNAAGVDFLNIGYTKWILHKTKEAVSYLKSYAESVDAADRNILNDFNMDKNMLEINGIKSYELKLMVDALGVS